MYFKHETIAFLLNRIKFQKILIIDIISLIILKFKINVLIFFLKYFI